MPLLWITLAFLAFMTMIGQLAFVLIRDYCRPHKAVAWLVILCLFPFIGFLFYGFVAREFACFRPQRQRALKPLGPMRKQLADRCLRTRTADSFNGGQHRSDGLNAVLLTLQSPQSLPLTAGNEITVYEEGNAAFDAMFEAISAAKHHIHIEFYIVRDDTLGEQFRQLLIRKAGEGVKIRLLYDGIGCCRLRKTYLEPFNEAGIEIGCFAPLLRTLLNQQINYRNHRKIVVVDGKVGFIGGLNVGDEYLGKSAIGYWRDTHFKIQGDAVLWIQYTFAEDWLWVKRKLLTDPEYYPVQPEAGNEFVQIVKSGPDETILELMFTFIISAKQRIYVETPYFVPDPGMLLALKTAAMRGVDVRIVIPANPDTKLVYWASLSFVQELLQVGIRFYLYRKGFIHAKVIISDDVACSGSVNMDMRSFTGQFEISAVFFGGAVLARLMNQFHRDLAVSDELTLGEFEKRPKAQKRKEIFARLLSPLF